MATDDEHAVPTRGGARGRKGSSIRTWLVLSESGGSHLEDVGKHSIMRRTGLPARDLRVLDPLLSYPSTILGRERAIVTNLEHIKAVITATEVLVPNSKDPLVAPFIHDLQTRVVAATPAHQGMVGGPSQPSWISPSLSPRWDQQMPVKNSGKMETNLKNLCMTQERITKVLPFEFRALEVCLESACRCLESETVTLEQEAYPALDELTSQISTLNLERVRQIKSRLVAISGRVQKVRDELEHLLDDDTDMAEMYLTEKVARHPAAEMSSRADQAIETYEVVEEINDVSENETESSNESAGFKPDIEELEMLLEAYFVQIDGTLNKLSTLREYVDDTEDYINIMLDEKQNQLLEMGVMLSTATLVCSAGIVVVSIFGMNIGISLYDGTGSAKFWETTIGTVIGCVILYIIAVYWGKKSGLIH